MGGVGGVEKLSVEFQEAVIGALVPASLSCGDSLSRLDGLGGDDRVADLRRKLEACMADIGRLLEDVEAGHSRMSVLDPDEVEWQMDFLLKEVRSLRSELQTVLSLCRTKGRGG